MTLEGKLRKFRYARERDPASDEELASFIFEIARELYNHEIDEWPEDDEELA